MMLGYSYMHCVAYMPQHFLHCLHPGRDGGCLKMKGPCTLKKDGTVVSHPSSDWKTLLWLTHEVVSWFYNSFCFVPHYELLRIVIYYYALAVMWRFFVAPVCLPCYAAKLLVSHILGYFPIAWEAHASRGFSTKYKQCSLNVTLWHVCIMTGATEMPDCSSRLS